MGFITSAVQAPDQNVYTFAATNIGTPTPTRRVIVAVSTSSARVIDTATIGGIDATIDGAHAVSGTASLTFISAIVPTGTTADIVVNLDTTTSALGMGIGVWAYDGVAPSGQVATGSGDPAGLTIATTAGDIVLGYAFTTGHSTATFAWSNLVERFEQDVYSATTTHSGADGVATGTSLAVSVDPINATTAGLAIGYSPVPAIEGAFTVDAVTDGSMAANLDTRGAFINPVAAASSMAPRADRKAGFTAAVASASALAPRLVARAAFTNPVVATQSFTPSGGGGASFIIDAISAATMAPRADRRAALVPAAAVTTSTMTPRAALVAAFTNPVAAASSMAPLARRLASGTVIVTSATSFAPTVPPRATVIYFEGSRIARAYHHGEQVTIR